MVTALDGGASLTCVSCHGLFRSNAAAAMLKSREGLVYRRSLLSMQTSAKKEGCLLCQELLDMDLSSETCRPHLFTPVEERQSQQNRPGASLLSRRTRASFRFFGDLQRDRKLKVIRSVILERDTTNFIEATTPFGDPAEKHICTQSPNLDPRSDRTFRKVRQWLDECEHEHSEDVDSPCVQWDEAPFPTRVLDLGTGNSVRLIDGKGIRGQYIALSYCWGGEQPHALNTSNIEEYRCGIPSSTLPRSIQDAIFTARKLGIQYLWVDSLSIIQDSEADKDAQMALMGKVYGNAYLTISAASASSCHDGFLSVRDEQRCIITLPFCCEDGEIGTICLWIRSESRFTRGVGEPLDSRAWALQERFMSSRLLVFSQIQVFFLCGKIFGSDGGTIKRLEYMNLTGNVGDRRRPTGVMPMVYSGINETEIRKYWIQVAKDFSTRKLSNPEDKLPAISSIAGYIKELYKENSYLAGLWGATLLKDLSWHKPPGKFLQRSSVWRCPSWSYMSVDGDISFLSRHQSDFQPQAEIQKCSTKPATSAAPFGRVESGYLEMKAYRIKVQPLKFRKDGDGIKFWQQKGIAASPVGILHYDTVRVSSSAPPLKVITNHGELKWNAPVYCLLIGVQKDESTRKQQKDEYLWGLVLARLEIREYHRIGWFTSDMASLETFTAKPKRPTIII